MNTDSKIKTIAYIFPGQGSQVLGMGLELTEAFPSARQIFHQADELLGYSISKLCWEGPVDELNDTVNTQPALLVHSIAALRVLEEQIPGITPLFVAGHSMGELSALIASGSLDFEFALHLARRRGELMKEAGVQTPGGMAAMLGAEISLLEQICAEASKLGEVVQVANDNCPGQVVISGAFPALERAIDLAQKAGVRKIRRLAVSIGAHSPLMLYAQEHFFQAVADSPIKDPTVPLIGNVSAKPLLSAAAIRDDLHGQLTSRVRWTETIQEMQRQGTTHFFEIGCGNVLTNLLKRIDDTLQGFSLGTPADFEKLIEVLS